MGSTYIQRDLEEKLKRYLLKGPEFLAVTGPRQAGKTTLVEHALSAVEAETGKAVRRVTFEDEDALGLFNEDVKAFADLHLSRTDILFIDEFQHALDGGKKLKYLFDIYAKGGKKLVISGSSALELSLKSLQPLVGRILTFELYPLSFKEFLGHRDPDLLRALQQSQPEALLRMAERHLKEFMICGGYPRVVLAEDEEEKRLVFKSIYDLLVKKDMRDYLDAADTEETKRLLTILAAQAGGMLNYHTISRLMGVSFAWVKQKITLLEELYLVRRLEPFFENKRLEVTKMPKLFFLDQGLLNHITNNRALTGHVVENYVFSELLKQGLGLNYWRTKSKAEVDFIIDRAYPLEVKTASRTSRALHSFSEKYRPKKAFITSMAPAETKAFTSIPLAMIWDVKRGL